MRRTGMLTRITQDESGVDEVVIDSWFHLEMMADDKGHFVYDLHIGEQQFEIIVPKEVVKSIKLNNVRL